VRAPLGRAALQFVEATGEMAEQRVFLVVHADDAQGIRCNAMTTASAARGRQSRSRLSDTEALDQRDWVRPSIGHGGVQT
jgi:hypothetical protein